MQNHEGTLRMIQKRTWQVWRCLKVKGGFLVDEITLTWTKKYNSPSGKITAKKRGIAKLMVQIAANNSRVLLRKPTKVLGTKSSIISMSLENLFTILPKGVISKNVMGEWRTLMSNALWSLRDANTEPKAWTKHAARMNTAWEKPSPPYIPRSRVCSDVEVAAVEELVQWASQIRAAVDQHSANRRKRKNEIKRQAVMDLM